jgi:hypothetical protein
LLWQPDGRRRIAALSGAADRHWTGIEGRRKPPLIAATATGLRACATEDRAWATEDRAWATEDRASATEDRASATEDRAWASSNASKRLMSRSFLAVKGSLDEGIECVAALPTGTSMPIQGNKPRCRASRRSSCAALSAIRISP